MKKINLRGLTEVLSEKELKNVLGGSGGFEWTDHGSGTCGFKVTFSDGYYVYGCGMTLGEALHYMYAFSPIEEGVYVTGNWYCCDQCSTTSYCG